MNVLNNDNMAVQQKPWSFFLQLTFPISQENFEKKNNNNLQIWKEFHYDL